MLELADAYETAGNQLYRLAEAAAQSVEIVEPEIGRTEAASVRLRSLKKVGKQ